MATSISPNSAPHVLVINYLIELPFGKNKRYLNTGGVVDKLVGGWQVNGINRYQSGVPLSFFTSDPLFTDFLQLRATARSLAIASGGRQSTGQHSRLRRCLARALITIRAARQSALLLTLRITLIRCGSLARSLRLSATCTRSLSTAKT